MAISDNPLKIEQMGKVEASDFNEEQDANQDSSLGNDNGATPGNNSSNALGGLGNKLNDMKANTALPNLPSAGSVFDKLPKKPENIKYSKNSIFTDILCCKMPSIKIRQMSFMLGLDKFISKLNYGLDLCANKKNNDPIDTGLTIPQFITNNPGLITGSLESRFTALLNSEIANCINILGMSPSTMLCCVTNGSKNSLNKAVQPVGGGSITLRKKIQDIANRNECSSALLGNSQGLLGIFAGSSILNTMLDSDPTSAKGWVDASLKFTGLQNTVLGSITASLGNAHDIYKKLELVSDIDITEEQCTKIYTDVSNVIVNITEDNVKYDTIDKALNRLDKNWIYLGGELNPYKARNEKLGKAAKVKLLARTSELSLTGEYTTTIEAPHAVAIVNSFKPNINVIIPK